MTVPLRYCGHWGNRHTVPLSRRDTPQPWICAKCDQRVIGSPDRSEGGFIAVDPYIIEEELNINDLNVPELT